MRLDLASLDALRGVALACQTLPDAAAVFANARARLRALVAAHGEPGTDPDQPSDELLLGMVREPRVSAAIVDATQVWAGVP